MRTLAVIPTRAKTRKAIKASHAKRVASQNSPEQCLLAPHPWIPAFAGMTGSRPRLSFPRKQKSSPACPD